MSEPCFNSFEDMDDPFNLLKKDLDNIYMPDTLDNPMMSSEFFDSVFSMEQSVHDNELNVDTDVTSNGDPDLQLNSDIDDSNIRNSCSSPDSATSYELNDFVILNNKVQQKSSNTFKKAERNSSSLLSRFAPSLFNSKGNGKKVILTKPNVNKSNNFKLHSNAKQVIRVQSLSGKGGSVLLPFNVASLKNIKIIKGKELHAENVKFTKVSECLPQNIYVDRVSSPETFDEDDSDESDVKMDQDCKYPKVKLSDEEQRLLMKEGIFLPSHYPLTKQEEKDLKRIRRKIRNKISAQDSRKRKKEYVDGLEERLRQGAEEKKFLLSHVKQLQKQNSNLVMQMNKLQVLVCNTTASKATPTASLLIVLLSVLLISLPNLRTPKDTEWKEEQAVVRRSLLSSKASYEDMFNLEEFLTQNKDDETDFKTLFEDENATEEFTYSNYMEKFENKFQNLEQKFLKDDAIKTALDKSEVDSDIRDTFDKVKTFFLEMFDKREKRSGVFEQSTQVKKKFIEPDIDDDDIDLPAKRIKTYSGQPKPVIVNNVKKE